METNIYLCPSTLQADPMACTPDDFLSHLEVAKSVGYFGISQWYLYWMLITGEGMSAKEAGDAIADAGLDVCMIEAVLPWTAPDDAKAVKDATDPFEVAVALGAENVLSVCMGNEMEDVRSGAARYKEICKAAADFGLNVPIEFLPFGAISGIEVAWQIVETAGQDNGGILIDTWHWQRQPGGPDHETLRKIPGEFIRVVQLCDAAHEPQGDAMTECMTARLLPGEGAVDFPPLMESLHAIGADPVWSPEVFSQELVAKGKHAMAEAVLEASQAVIA